MFQQYRQRVAVVFSCKLSVTGIDERGPARRQARGSIAGGRQEASMQEEPATCGQGLAANAVVPEKIAALMDATANVLQNHMRSLDPADAVARLERDAYEHIIEEQRGVASKLNSLARAMRSYRDLPMAPHNEDVLADGASIDVFSAFIDAEENMLALLQENVRSDRDMLGAMLPT
jgi:hypothetical protein